MEEDFLKSPRHLAIREDTFSIWNNADYEQLFSRLCCKAMLSYDGIRKIDDRH